MSTNTDTTSDTAIPRLPVIKTVLCALILLTTACSGGGSSSLGSNATPDSPTASSPTPTPPPSTPPTPVAPSNPAPEPSAPAPTPKPALGSATLSWSIPTARENGDPLAMADLAGYEIYYTTDSGAEKNYKVSNPSQTSYTINSLKPDTYYFAMAVIDTDGMYSELSNTASKTIK